MKIQNIQSINYRINFGEIDEPLGKCEWEHGYKEPKFVLTKEYLQAIEIRRKKLIKINEMLNDANVSKIRKVLLKIQKIFI